MSYLKWLIGRYRTSGSTEVADTEACILKRKGRCIGETGRATAFHRSLSARASNQPLSDNCSQDVKTETAV